MRIPSFNLPSKKAKKIFFCNFVCWDICCRHLPKHFSLKMLDVSRCAKSHQIRIRAKKINKEKASFVKPFQILPLFSFREVTTWRCNIRKYELEGCLMFFVIFEICKRGSYGLHYFCSLIISIFLHLHPTPHYPHPHTLTTTSLSVYNSSNRLKQLSISKTSYVQKLLFLLLAF
jgi:hypothetical protein